MLYSNIPPMKTIKELQNAQGVKSLDKLNSSEQDLLAVALGAPARQVLLRAEEVGPRTGWRDGYLTTEYGFVPPDADEAAGALAKSPGRVWSDLCERMPGCVARGRVRESVAALPVVEETSDIIPDRALWAGLVSLGMLCSIYRYEAKHNGTEGVNISSKVPTLDVEMSDELGDEVKGIPKSIGLPYYQISREWVDRFHILLSLINLHTTSKFGTQHQCIPTLADLTTLIFSGQCLVIHLKLPS